MPRNYDELIAQAIKDAHSIQDFLFSNDGWDKYPFNQRDWADAFQKRVDSIAAIDFSVTGWKLQLRKRLLQLASLAIKADGAVDLMVVPSSESLKPNTIKDAIVEDKMVTGLGRLLYTLIVGAIKTTGTYAPEENLPIFEESLTSSEFHKAYNFLKWCHTYDKTFGSVNYEQVYRDYLNDKR